jgi:hypothetical protein
MGVVYKARHLALKRLVALKVVLHGEFAGGEALARFRTEANAAARLQHPNVVAIHEAGEHDGRPYLVLEFVDGGTLAGKLAAGPLPLAAAARLLRQLAGAVQFAHDRGVLHRDLKPANILLATPGTPDEIGTPKIADFGLAKPLTADSSLAAGAHTQTGAILGTPSYMAPEQAGGKSTAVGAPADVWALGALLYECLTGRPPFQAGNMVDTLLQVATEDPTPPRRLRPDCPRDLETICLKCLHKDPVRRYATAGALADDLGHFLAGQPIAARPAGRLEQLGRALKRRRELVGLAAGALAVALISFLLLYFRGGRPEPPVGPAGAGAVAPLPDDLRLLPAGHFYFTFRVGDLWARADARTLIERWYRTMTLTESEAPTWEGLEDKLAHIRKKLDLGPEHVERLTFALLRANDAGSQLLLVALSKPGEPQRVRDLLKDLLGENFALHAELQVNGKTFYHSDDPQGFPMGFGALHDRLFVLAPVSMLRWVAERADQERGFGPLSPALALAAQRPAAMAGFNAQQDPGTFGGRPLPAKLRIPEGLAAITAVVELPEPSPGRPLTGLSLELIGYCADDEQARLLLDRVRAATPGFAAQMEAEAAASPFARFLPLVTGPLRAAEYVQEGPRARMRVRFQWQSKDMEEMQRVYIDGDRREQVQTNLRHIGQGLGRYANQNGGRLPPAAVYAKDGRPLLSWRVLLLPQLGQEPLFKQFRLDEAWDGSNNKKLIDQMPAVYSLAPADLDAKPTPGTTVYRALVGPGAAFEGRQGVPLKDFTDGIGHTAVVVAAGPPTPWTKPDDWPYDPAKPVPRPAGLFSDGFFALFADGAVHLLPADLDEKSWRALITRKAADKPPKLPPWWKDVPAAKDL